MALPDLLHQIHGLKAELDALRPLDREQEGRIMQKFRLDWNFHSNHLEGNSLTYGETRALLLFGITAQGKPLKDHVEMTGHNEAIQLLEEVVREQRPLTESLIRELNTLILRTPYRRPALTPDGQPATKLVVPGAYKRQPNHVLTITGEMFYFASPEETPARMTDLMDWARDEKKAGRMDAVVLAAEFHYKFIRIHPFDDGNGRTARMLMNFLLMQHGLPPVVVKTEEKNAYLAALRQADAGLLEPFATYIARNLVHSLEIMLKGARGESIDEPNDLDKEIALLEQQLKGMAGVELVRTEALVAEVVDRSVIRLADAFFRMSEKFARLYEGCVFRVDSFNEPSAEEGFHSRWSEKVLKSPPFEQVFNEMRHKAIFYTKNGRSFGFEIGCDFNQNKTFKAFSHFSFLRIGFELTQYSIGTSTGIQPLVKYYSEDLDDAEIDLLINVEAEHHAGRLREKMKEVKKQK